MATRTQSAFQTVKTEGALLPADLLKRIADGDKGIEGLSPESYHLDASERINEVTNRAWTACRDAWQRFQNQRATLPDSDAGTTLTRERWLLVMFRELGYGRLQSAKPVEIEGKSYSVSHAWATVPIHLISFRYDLDHAVRDVSRVSAHSLVQELLNRSSERLWGLVSNGLQLRILRDNVSFTRAAYVEFDLETMMEGEVYSDFVLLWLLCHQSRVEAEGTAQCWLEKWHQAARQQGTRALDSLRDGVERAIQTLGQAFLAHTANRGLRDKLGDGSLTTQAYYQQLLRLVYRFIFLFAAEDRDLLLVPAADHRARARYEKNYSLARIRRLAERRRGTRHSDLWQSVQLTLGLLYKGEPRLGLPGLGSFLFSGKAMPDLEGCELANDCLLEAVRHLAFTLDGKVLRQVDYKNLGSEELGSVYESLLELHPTINTAAATFDLSTAAGSERKTTGSYYTPSSLITCLLDSALDPVIEQAISKSGRKPVPKTPANLKRACEDLRNDPDLFKTALGIYRSSCEDPSEIPDNEALAPIVLSLSEYVYTPENQILNLKVCDPACGSGHFLIAAANRLAHRLARVRTGDDEPSPTARRAAFRDVVSHCIYGVDINPMAVELCKVALWLESLEPGKPLSFLEHRIQCGNSLIGAMPRLLKEGIPDAAFTPIEGDDKAVCSEFRRRNKDERKGQQHFEWGAMPQWRLGNMTETYASLAGMDDDSLAAVETKEQRYAEWVQSAGYQSARLLADAWCAAFVWKKDKSTQDCITEEWFRRIEANPHSAPPWMREEIARLTEQYQFFHWHLAFPDAFRVSSEEDSADNQQTGWTGGFDCVLGNPPWERIKLQEKEWFASRRPDIANASNAARRRQLIEALKDVAPELFQAFTAERRHSEGESSFIRMSGRYHRCGTGDINTYAVFTEAAYAFLSAHGRLGFIVPSGIATDDSTKAFFGALVDSRTLVSVFAFENEAKLFPGIDHRNKFALLTCCGEDVHADNIALAFGLHTTDDLRDPQRRYCLRPSDILHLNPNTKTCPAFRRARDADLAAAIYARVPVLVREGAIDTNPWGLKIRRILDMNKSAVLRKTTECREALWETGKVPVYEAKMIHQFDHRFGTYDGQTQAQARQSKLPELSVTAHADPHLRVLPRYWIDPQDAKDSISSLWTREWLLVWRDIASAVVLRTSIAAVIPFAGTDFTLRVGFLANGVAASCASTLVAVLNSIVFDYCARQKVGGIHLSDYVTKQLPVPTPATCEQQLGWDAESSLTEWLKPRSLELIFTAWDIAPFARDCGYSGPPLGWDSERRFAIRCEIDAALFHTYGIEYEGVAYILDTFPIMRENDEVEYGYYRTKETILTTYDEMAQVMAENAAAVAAGRPATAVYRTRLDPPPGPLTLPDGTFAPLPTWLPGQPRPANWPKHIHPPRDVAEAIRQPQRPAARLVERGRAVAYITTLVRTVNKPWEREPLEVALILMLNDDIRQAVLGTAANWKPGGKERDEKRAIVEGMDRLFATLQDGDVLRPKEVRGRHGFEAGDKAVPLDKLTESDRRKAREAIKALEVFGLDRAKTYLQEESHAEFAVR